MVHLISCLPTVDSRNFNFLALPLLLLPFLLFFLSPSRFFSLFVILFFQQSFSLSLLLFFGFNTCSLLFSLFLSFLNLLSFFFSLLCCDVFPSLCLLSCLSILFLELLLLTFSQIFLSLYFIFFDFSSSLLILFHFLLRSIKFLCYLKLFEIFSLSFLFECSF